jgi:hypothetical protein
MFYEMFPIVDLVLSSYPYPTKQSTQNVSLVLMLH